MKLDDYIQNKLIELKEIWKVVEFDNAENVVLTKNGTASEFNSKQTSLQQTGKEVRLADLEVASTVPFIPNGSVVNFNVKAPRKRKFQSIEHYFLWE